MVICSVSRIFPLERVSKQDDLFSGERGCHWPVSSED